MGVVVKQKLYEQVPPGTHAARLHAVEDLGDQNTPYGQKDQVKLTYITSAKGANGEPLFVTEIYNKSLYGGRGKESKLRKHAAVMLRGAAVPLEIDLTTLIGTDVLLVIDHVMGKDGLRSWARIQAVLPASAPPPPPSTPPPAATSFTVAPPATNGPLPVAVPQGVTR